MKRLPKTTIGVLSLSVAAAIFPDLSSAMIYSRSAMTSGEVWRMISCHFVHFDLLHLTYNLLAFGVAGVIIENRGYPYFKSLLFSTALTISFVLFLFKPNMTLYGGLSGLACGSILYFAFWGIIESQPWRTTCFLLIFLILLKISLEFIYGSSALPFSWENTFVIAPLSHLTGALSAALFFIFGIYRHNKTGTTSQKPLQVEPNHAV
ncbi:MAG: rhombosortase [Thermodesulfobacteriota bacterium]